MLIRKEKFAPNQIVSLKLITGEEVIGFFVERNNQEKTITIRKPTVPVVMTDGIGLAPFVMTANIIEENTPLVLNIDSVITIVPTGSQFSSVYMQEVSGIEIPKTTQ